MNANTKKVPVFITVFILLVHYIVKKCVRESAAFLFADGVFSKLWGMVMAMPVGHLGCWKNRSLSERHHVYT